MGITTPHRSDGSAMLAAVLRSEGVEKVRRLTGRSEACIRHWANGRNRPDTEGRVRLADCYGIPIGAWGGADLPSITSLPLVTPRPLARELLLAQAERILRRIARLEESSPLLFDEERLLAGVLSRLHKCEGAQNDAAPNLAQGGTKGQQ